MTADVLDATFAALADPTRRAILARLAEGEATVTELAAPFAMTQPGVSKHLRVLERAGLITRGRDAQRRPCRLQAGPLKDAMEWLASYRQYWEESYQRLDDLLAELEAGRSGPPAAFEEPEEPEEPEERHHRLRMRDDGSGERRDGSGRRRGGPGQRSGGAGAEGAAR
ncbi:metalloregulator ArsR/SmtB family transcription factor [Sphaerisporangium sp. NPDC005288]|uniref:ArsR/SmtB family transcription factor n=1 Tax=Sphaerisporangium sp. NPDC005288 TaxID=3155114 RepID=UPI00339E0A2C